MFKKGQVIRLTLTGLHIPKRYKNDLFLVEEYIPQNIHALNGGVVIARHLKSNTFIGSYSNERYGGRPYSAAHRFEAL